MNNKVAANVEMTVAKIFSGLNSNALKFLIPAWMAPLTGVTLRLGFGAIAFWIIGLFTKKEPKTTFTTKFKLFMLGAIAVTGFMTAYLTGLKYTTPTSSSILLSLSPVWVFIISLIFYGERFTWLKGLGLFISLVGASLTMLSKQAGLVAENPIFGDFLTIISSFCYAIYLVFSQQMLKVSGPITLTKWTFTGAAFCAVIINIFTGWDAPVLSTPIHWLALLVLLFVLIFPTTLSYYLQMKALKYLPSTVVAMYGYLIIVVASITALILGQDKFEWIMVLSIILLCVGLYLVEAGETKAPPRPIDAK